MAPLVLLAALVAVGVVVSTTTGGGGEASPAQPSTGSEQERTSTQSSTATRSETTGDAASGPGSYTVKSGDTLGSIAESAGVAVTELQELNPDLDPQSLTVGQRIRLRR
jgi:LysM repeat protein